MSERAWGLDLTGSKWPCVRRVIERNPLNLRDEELAPIPGTDLLQGSAPILLPSADGGLDLPISAVLTSLKDWLGRWQNPLAGVPTTPTDLIGVAYPRTMPPMLRFVLPTLFGKGEIGPKGMLPTNSPLFGIDAPTALTLEALALQAVTAPAKLAVATESGSTWEWTKVTIEIANPELRVPFWRIHLGRVADSPEALGLPPNAPRLVAGDPPLDHDAGSIVRLSSTAIAEGAARFALWRAECLEQTNKNAFLIRGYPVISSEIVHPLGILGHNGEGSWFWRRLFEPGTSIPLNRANLLSKSPGKKTSLEFAECLGPADRETLWIPQNRWAEVDLRWHSYHPHTDVLPPPPLIWSIQLRDYNDNRADAELSKPRTDPPPRWGLPTWKIRPKTVEPVEPPQPL